MAKTEHKTIEDRVAPFTAIIVLFLTAISYMGVYIYQAAYLHYFGLDYRTVQVTPEDMLFVGASILILSLYSYPAIRTILGRGVIRQQRSSTKQRIVEAIVADLVVIIVTFLLFVGVTSYTGFLLNNLKGRWLLLIALFVYRFIMPQLGPNFSGKSLSERAKLHASEQRKYFRLDLLILLVFLLTFFFAAIGNGDAKGKNEFEVINNNQIVVADHNNTLVVANIDGKGHLTGKYEFINMNYQRASLSFQVKTIEIVP